MWRLLIAALVAVVALSVGCGTARIDLKTNVLPSGEVDQELVITGDGALGEALKESYRPEEIRKEGWNAELKSQGNGYVMQMAKRLKKGESWFPPSKSDSPTGGTSRDAQVDFKINEGLLDKEYRVRIVLPPSVGAAATPGKTETERQMAQLGEQLVKTMFKMTWTINLPGEVLETNADSSTKTGGTWEFGIEQMQRGREMTLVSRERRDLTPFLAGGAALLGLVGFGALRLRRRPA